MKKVYQLILVVILPTCSFAQISELNFNHQNIDFSAAPRTAINPMSIKLWDNYNNGGPAAYGTVMEIYGLSGHQTSQLHFGGWDNSRIRYREAFYAQNTWSDWVTLLDSKNNIASSGNLQLTGLGNHYLSQGNLGIGTTTPGYKFETVDYSSNWSGRFINNSNSSAVYFAHGGGYGLHINVGTNASANTYAMQIYDPIGYNLFYVRGDGNVGIGTGNPDQKLSVNGKIRAKEVKVETANWPDYVFDKSYELKELEGLERFIKENRHLPEIPSVSEVKEQGIELGEMNAKLLRKIEEVTLYLIDQNKMLKEQGIMLKEQQQEINQLKSKIK